MSNVPVLWRQSIIFIYLSKAVLGVDLPVYALS